jgi:hypothetical protein
MRVDHIRLSLRCLQSGNHSLNSTVDCVILSGSKANSVTVSTMSDSNRGLSLLRNLL